MNKISKDFLDIFSGNVFIDSISTNIVPDSHGAEFCAWHTFNSKVAISSLNYQGGYGVSPSTYPDFGDNQGKYFTVFLDQKKQTAGLSVGFVGGGYAEGMMDISVAGSLVNGIDWSSSPQLQLQYMTEVIDTFGGHEQRISLRDKPRISVTYSYVVDDQDRYNFENRFISGSGLVMIPLWMFQSHGNIDGDTITIIQENEYIKNAEYLLVSDEQKSEILRVRSTTPGVAQLFFLAEKNFNTEVLVAPVFPAYISDESSASSVINSLDRHQIRFEIDEESMRFSTPNRDEMEKIGDLIYDEYFEDYYQVNEKLVLPFRPDRSSDITIQHARLREYFDPLTGAKSRYDRVDGSIRVFSFNFKFFSEQERQRFEDFTSMANGAAWEFYCESPVIAFELASDIAAPSKTIAVKKSGYSSIFGTSAKSIAIRMYNGDVAYKRIIGVESGGADVDLVELYDELGPVSISEIDYIAPLFLSRFESDDFTYSFATTGVSSITKTIKQVIHAESSEY